MILAAGAQFLELELRQRGEPARRRWASPELDIHPDDAAARGVADDSYVRVFNERGSLRLRARVSDRTRRGVVVALGVVEEARARRQERE